MDEQHTLTPVPLAVILQLYEEARQYYGYDGSIWPFFDFFAPIEEEQCYG